jgi:N6-adenosine-specific RNA methylase IME4/ParB-like chromosome segregation protein Spo0J
VTTMTQLLKPHPAADLFPMMTDAELNDLAADIKLRGQNRPIIVFEGKILDGRNRYEACNRAEVQPKIQEWNALDKLAHESSPTAWVLSENLHRRHLTVDQRALIALEAQALFSQEAKGRQKAAGGDRKSVHAPDRLPPRGGKRSPTAAAQAAQTAGVSARSVERARRVQDAKPELLKQVREGKLTLKKAERIVAKGERLTEVLAYTPPKGRYSVIAADPPWEYDDKLDGSDSARGGVDYPTMPLDEICAMKVGETLATPNCALWLWVTNAFLIDGSAARVVREWGFEPKGLLTWEKDHWGGGHYLRGQTEHVILAIRGRPLVQGENTASFFRAKRGAHSEKPEEAYAIFEKVTPSAPGARLDLFACKPRKGWFASGAEVSGAAGVKASKRKGKR